MSRLSVLVVLCIVQVLTMALWFGVSAVTPSIAADWSLTQTEASWLTLSVQFGFVAGTLVSAVFTLSDVLSAQRLIAGAGVGAAIANATLALVSEGIASAVILRFLTGMLLAGVYPPGMKLVASWFRRGRGLALGTLVGALTLGKGSPYLITALSGGSWRDITLVASLLAAGGSLLVLMVHEGPEGAGRAPFDIRQAGRTFANRGVRLASFGYFGHMWELYAMWLWFPVMFRASVARSGAQPWLAELLGAFAVIGGGAIGCVAAGAWADRIGRTAVTSIAMLVSGICCILVGPAFGMPLLLLAVASIWGVTVVADSAQFSTCVTQALSDPRYVGTALTLQTCIGFLITSASMALIPRLVDLYGWSYAFLALAPGPILGTLAMLRLRSLPESLKLAGGKR